MFQAELETISQIAAQAISRAGFDSPKDLRWQPIPFSGEWGYGSAVCFQIAAQQARDDSSPVPERAQRIAAAIADQIRDKTPLGHIEAVRGYLNLYIDAATFAARVVDRVLEAGDDFGRGEPKGERVMVEYAQPNTHHSFHIGHARNAILGEALSRLVEFAGFETIRASYPGDIGLGVITCCWAYQRFYRGQEPEGVHERGQWLAKIYTEATALITPKENETPEERELREGYDAERREMYRRWDEGDPEVRELWLRTRQWSLDELEAILGLLDIHIDVFFYESEVDELAKEIVDELIALQIAEDERPEGPVIVRIDEKLGLKKEKYRTAVILRSDGTTLYQTKDLALAKLKFERFGVDRSVYVVDVRQSLHFQQVFKILELWGFPQAQKCYHLAYGFVTLPEGAMSARRGNVVLFMDVYEEAKRRVREIISEKNPALQGAERERVAEQIGLGALVYSMLCVDNNKDIVFDWGAALSFDGQSAPYIQNAYTRASSILRNATDLPASAVFDYPLDDSEVELIERISHFPLTVQKSAQEYKPLHMATYAYELARAFHQFYHRVRVLQADTPQIRAARIRLTAAARQTLANALRLLAIQATEAM